VPVVIDASVAAKWLLRDETSKAADAALATVSHEGAAVPSIFPFEIENILIVAERRQRIGAADVEEAITLLKALDLRIDPFTNGGIGKQVEIARRCDLTSYDAAYLVLASRLRATLFTADDRLAAAARKEHVSVVIVS
jgi:predicted nucleic acid-binding protein